MQQNCEQRGKHSTQEDARGSRDHKRKNQGKNSTGLIQPDETAAVNDISIPEQRIVNWRSLMKVSLVHAVR